MATRTMDLPEAPCPQATSRLTAECRPGEAPLALHQHHQAPGSRHASVCEAPARRRAWWPHDVCTRSAWSPWKASPAAGYR